MTLYETIHKIKEVANNNPAVNQIVENDIFKLNTLPDVRYGVFSYLQRQHYYRDGLNYFRFVFYYVDRLTFDKGNEVEVQSTAIEVLTQIVRGLENLGIGYDGDITFNTFTERFTDECAGAWCEVTLIVPDGWTC